MVQIHPKWRQWQAGKPPKLSKCCYMSLAMSPKQICGKWGHTTTLGSTLGDLWPFHDRFIGCTAWGGSGFLLYTFAVHLPDFCSICSLLFGAHVSPDATQDITFCIIWDQRCIAAGSSRYPHENLQSHLPGMLLAGRWRERSARVCLFWQAFSGHDHLVHLQ